MHIDPVNLVTLPISSTSISPSAHRCQFRNYVGEIHSLERIQLDFQLTRSPPLLPTQIVVKKTIGVIDARFETEPRFFFPFRILPLE